MPPQILPITLKSSPLAIALVGLQLPTIISPSHHVTESRGHLRLPQALVRSHIPTFWGAKIVPVAIIWKIKRVNIKWGYPSQWIIVSHNLRKTAAHLATVKGKIVNIEPWKLKFTAKKTKRKIIFGKLSFLGYCWMKNPFDLIWTRPCQSCNAMYQNSPTCRAVDLFWPQDTCFCARKLAQSSCNCYSWGLKSVEKTQSEGLSILHPAAYSKSLWIKCVC